MVYLNPDELPFPIVVVSVTSDLTKLLESEDVQSQEGVGGSTTKGSCLLFEGSLSHKVSGVDTEGPTNSFIRDEFSIHTS